MNEGKVLTHAAKDAMASGMIESIMDSLAGKASTCFKCGKPFKRKKLSQQDIALLKLRYDKLRPSLSTIEQRLIDPGEKMTDGQIISQLHSLITSSPTVVVSLLGLLIKADRGAVERALVSQAQDEQSEPAGPVLAVPKESAEQPAQH